MYSKLKACIKISMVVKIISSDDVEMEILYEIAVQSKILELFLNPELNNSRNKMYNYDCEEMPVKLPINSKFLKRTIEYLNYKYKCLYEDAAEEFIVLEEETMDLLEIASYLKI